MRILFAAMVIIFAIAACDSLDSFGEAVEEEKRTSRLHSPTPTPEPSATESVWRIEWYLECPDSYEHTYGTQYPQGFGSLWTLDDFGTPISYTGESISCGRIEYAGQRREKTAFIQVDVDCDLAPRFYYPLELRQTWSGNPVLIQCYSLRWTAGVGIDYTNDFTATPYNPRAQGDTTVSRESYESYAESYARQLAKITPTATATTAQKLGAVRIAIESDENGLPDTVFAVCLLPTHLRVDYRYQDRTGQERVANADVRFDGWVQGRGRGAARCHGIEKLDYAP